MKPADFHNKGPRDLHLIMPCPLRRERLAVHCLLTIGNSHADWNTERVSPVRPGSQRPRPLSSS